MCLGIHILGRNYSFKFINRTRGRACGHADIHVRSHVRQKMNNIVVDWLFQLHRSAKPSFQVGAIKIAIN